MIANFHDPLLDAAKWARRTVVLIGLSVVALCAVAQEPADSTGVAEEADTIKYSVKLGDVEVKASNLTRRGGKDVYVVTDDMKRGLYNAGQLLSRVNGVVYNPITTDITYLGSKNVVILLDSVPKPADYIKRLSPDRFDRIDVINFPTGKYLGYDVLINYHSRPTYKGYESNLFSQAYALPGNKLGHGKWLQRNDAYADFTYTNGKWNIAAWMSDKWNRSAGQSGYANYYPANHFKESTVTTGRHAPTTLSRTNEMPGFLAVDYEINKLQSVSVQWSFAGEDWSTRNDYRLATENTLTHATDTIDYRTRSHTHGAWRNTFGAYYRGRFGAWSQIGRAHV